jgi:AAA family ATP:ADP antiporter
MPEPGASIFSQDAGRTKAWLAFAGFFFMIGGYALLKPVRDAAFLQRLGFTRMPLYDAYVAAGSLVVVTLYNLVVVRISRRLLVRVGFSLFILGIAVCAVLLKGGAAGPAAGFYVGLNLSWLLLLAVFWSTVNDVFDVGEGRVWYGLVALSGPFGALAGSALASHLTRPIGSVNLLWVSLGFFSVACCLLEALDRVGIRQPSSHHRVVLPVVFPDLRLLFRSRYVFWMAGLMLFGVFAMKIYLLDFNRLLTAYASSQDDKTQWAANRNVAVNGLGALLQVVVTPFVLKRYGPRPALLVLPLVSLVGGFVLSANEVFFVAFGVIAAAEGIAYTLNQSAKELLYVPGDRSLKYQAKALVDVFCFRLGDVMGSFVILGGVTFLPEIFQKTFSPALGLAMVGSLIWWAFARAAGKAFDAATRE